MPLSGRYADAFAKQTEGQVDAAGYARDHANRRAHETGAGGKRGQEHPLLPHLEHDLRACPRLEARASHQLSDARDAVGHRPIALAERQRMPVVEMHDLLVGVQGRRDHALAAEHVVDSEARVEDVEMAHAIEQRQDRGAASHGGRERLDCVFQVIRLGREKHEIEPLVELGGDHRRRRG